jgi:hypothetical protein
MGQNEPPSLAPGGDGCSPVSGRQKPDLQRNSTAIHKNDRVGSPLVRYFEGTAMSVSPLYGDLDVKS